MGEQIRIYDNNVDSPMWEYVGNDMGNGDKGTPLYEFQKMLLETLQRQRNHNTSTQIPACQYIIETYAQYCMLARCVDNHSHVLHPLAVSCLVMFEIQYYG